LGPGAGSEQAASEKAPTTTATIAIVDVADLRTVEKKWDNSGRKKPHKTLKIRAGKTAVTVEILPR
jgi:hypothetical protein